MPCNRLCRNCSCYWSIFRRCLSFNKGLPLQSHRNMSTKTARRAKCGTETLLVGTQPNASKRCRGNCKQCRPWSDCSSRGSLIWVCTVCPGLSVWKRRKITVTTFRKASSIFFFQENKHPLNTYMSHIVRKSVYAICKQQRRRSVCASVQSDKCLSCSLPG